jgi:glycosyltransferase involved in cell wall biosynthesis
MGKIAVLIPCYNEAKTIEKVVRDFKQALPDAEIYVYDNNSTDDTALLAERAGAVVRREYKQGKGNVVRRMFREIIADCYVIVDGDDTYPAQYAAEMAALVLDKQADMVIGDRLSSTYFTENKRLFHNFGNNLVRGLVNFIFKTDIADIMTGYRAFSLAFVKTFPVLSKGFEIETEMTFHALDKNMNINTVIVEYRDRPDGSVSKLNTYSDGFKVLKTIARLFKNYRPLFFLSIIAGLLAALSVILVVPVLVEYGRTGLVDRFPTLIVSGFLFMAALLSFFSGLVLDTIAYSRRQEFELQLNQLHAQANGGNVNGDTDQLTYAGGYDETAPD